jgi:hypothetical protein
MELVDQQVEKMNVDIEMKMAEVIKTIASGT